MTTSRILSLLAIAVLMAALPALPAAVPAGAGAPARQLYTCSMHPQVLLDHPGDCPICGMRLVPVRANTAAPAGVAAAPAPAGGARKIEYYRSSMMPGEVSTQPGRDSMGMDLVPVYAEAGPPAGAAIAVEPAMIQKMNLRTEVIRTGPVRREIRAVGIVALNERGLREITTKFDGWIERLFVDTTWAQVRAGDPLFEIYSPDLYNAELNYLIATRSEGESGGPLTHAARERLRLFDVPDSFVDELAHGGAAPRTYVFRAPADGTVIEKPAVQGMMVKAGETLYRLADLSSVRVDAQIYEHDLAFIHPGQAARVHSSFGGGADFAGTVELLAPEVAPATRTAQARVELPNPGLALRPGMFVDVRLEAELSPSAVLVPDLAVLRSGESNTVFVARGDGSFAPRTVTLGARTGDDDEVLSGLAAGERIVTSGQFLLDSESQLRAAIQRMTAAAAPAGAR